MRKPFLLVSTLLLSSAAAVAQPYAPVPRTYPDNPTSSDPNPYWDRDRDRYDRWDRSHWNRDNRTRWVTLASGYASTYRQNIHLRGENFDRLRIEAVRGRPVIRQVNVIYANGTSQVIRMNAQLQYGSGEVLRLNRMPIRRIVIFADPRYRGAYALYGGYGHRGRYGV
jgi:hypothetical protein